MPHECCSLSHHSKVRRLASLARTALAAYPLQGARLRVLAHIWNTTFRVTAANGDQYMLRVHHRGQKSAAAVRSELLWLAALREAGLSVPEPVPNKEHHLVTLAAHPSVPQPRLCVLFRWVDGRFLYRGLTPSHLAQVGDLMAGLHRHAAQWQRPREFTRHRVDNLDPMRRDQDDQFDAAVAAEITGLVASATTPEGGRVVAAAIARIWETMKALGQEPDAFGLIHADLHYRNVLFDKRGAGAIDFDDCGHGHWLYDLAVTLHQLERHPAYAVLRPAFLTGYRRRRPLPADQEAHLETFIALRRVQDLVGVVQEKDHPTFHDRWQAVAAHELEALRAFANR
jgi:Ser/Thr protein kinase RdoA (MazF antagonist)